jgi:hypothetical protein
MGRDRKQSHATDQCPRSNAEPEHRTKRQTSSRHHTLRVFSVLEQYAQIHRSKGVEELSGARTDRWPGCAAGEHAEQVLRVPVPSAPRACGPVRRAGLAIAGLQSRVRPTPHFLSDRP